MRKRTLNLVNKRRKKMEYKTRQELNQLSLKAFGTSSKWQKLVNNGRPELYERDREVVVPENGQLAKKIFKDQKVMIHRYTVEEIKKHMMQILEDRHNEIKRREAEAQAAAAANTESTVALEGGNFENGMKVTGSGIPENTTVNNG